MVINKLSSVGGFLHLFMD